MRQKQASWMKESDYRFIRGLHGFAQVPRAWCKLKHGIKGLVKQGVHYKKTT